MRDDDAFGFGGGAGSEDDLGGLIFLDRARQKDGGVVLIQAGQPRNLRRFRQRNFVSDENRASLYNLIDALDEFG